jgi:signal peptidase II
MRKRLALILLVVAATIGCDRVTKHWATRSLRESPPRSYAGDAIRLVYTENPGAFLGLGSTFSHGARFWMFTVGCGALLLGLAAWVALRRGVPLSTALAASLIVGGGAGNLVDRILHGRVVDFLNLGISSLRTGIFNVADVAITFGVILLLFLPRTRPARPDVP